MMKNNLIRKLVCFLLISLVFGCASSKAPYGQYFFDLNDSFAIANETIDARTYDFDNYEIDYFSEQDQEEGSRALINYRLNPRTNILVIDAPINVKYVHYLEVTFFYKHKKNGNIIHFKTNLPLEDSNLINLD